MSKLDKNSVINTTIDVLKKGGLVVFPSDTVYGLLVDATNEKAVEKLISFKNRPPGKAISVFVADMQMLEETVVMDSSKKNMILQLLPGPFTVILPSKHIVSKKLESEKKTLGVRIPSYEFVNKLAKEFGKPITATSANLGGKGPHYSIESLLNQLPKEKQEIIDLIVDAGKLPRNKPSTVIDLSEQEMKIVRKGDILFSDTQTFHSTTSSQTHKIGSFLIDKYIKEANGKPLVFVIQGDLGAGKTVLTKGIAEYVGIENIVSPTFVVYYEYAIENAQYQKLVHADLYNIEDPSEFKDLGLEEYLKDGNIMSIEWGEKLGSLFDSFRQKAQVIFVTIQYVTDAERTITIQK